MGFFQITIWTTHLNNRISVSANETVCNWILKRSIIPTGIQIDFFQLNPGTSIEAAYFMSPMSQSV